jgi:hypothetical protein
MDQRFDAANARKTYVAVEWKFVERVVVGGVVAFICWRSQVSKGKR